MISGSGLSFANKISSRSSPSASAIKSAISFDYIALSSLYGIIGETSLNSSGSSKSSGGPSCIASLSYYRFCSIFFN